MQCDSSSTKYFDTSINPKTVTQTLSCFYDVTAHSKF